MSLLAAPRRKQIVSVNPQGLNNAEEWKQFGGKLMAKSGWQDGEGLGANRQGATEHVQMRFKDDSLGLGCTMQYEQNWLAHNDDFNDLLASLNQQHGVSTGGEDTAESSAKESDQPVQVSLEKKSKSSRGRIHYQKFTRGKDLSSRSADDISMIFGGKASRKRKSDKSESQPETSAAGAIKDDASHVTGLNTYDSKESLHDYFAKKIAMRKQALQPTNASAEVLEQLEVKDEMDTGVDDGTRKKRKKSKNTLNEPEHDVRMEEEPHEIMVKGAEEPSDGAEVKKSHKRKKIKPEEAADQVVMADKMESVPKAVDVEETEEERRARRKQRKLEKRLAREAQENRLKEEPSEMENDGLQSAAEAQPDIVSMVKIPVDTVSTTEVEKGENNSAEAGETVTYARDLKKTMFGMSMGAIKQHFRSLPDETKAGIFPGSNVFEVKGYGDELCF